MKRYSFPLGLGLSLIALITFSCQQKPRTGEWLVTKSGNFERFWTLKDVQHNDSNYVLADNNSGIHSKFSLKDFKVEANVRTTAGAEGIFCVHFPQDANIPEHSGYHIFINNSDYGVGNQEKTGSLSHIRNNFVRTANDDQWFKLAVEVEGHHIVVSVNGKKVTEYNEPALPMRSKQCSNMVLSEGTLALYKTSVDGDITVSEVRVMPLNKSEETAVESEHEDAVTRQLTLLNQQGFPVIDYHSHLKGGLTMDELRSHGRDLGINYGVAANCGLKFPVTDDKTLNEYLESIKDEPVIKAMQCEGREWVTLFSPEAVAEFDYIFTDAMTWTDDKGRRMRLWIPEETFVENDQQFMEMLVSRIESIMSQEPVDIYVNPTFLPDELATRYDELWTPERMDRVIKVLKDNEVALEINARYRIPSMAFIKRAKEAGLKFTFGTNNAANELGRVEYCLEVVDSLDLTPKDMFVPRPAGKKKVQLNGLPEKITG
ncbi:DUF1080 domain-containing protein [Prolixibacter sp. NT017]|uniref:DUF1080 domain-containing protein n=1 Tax=Prolixibacter sp. NT017 TaxID=2652390 RepID=UPI00126E3EFB|nr:DUF1080 domain-containing protein [Prolixibacter sp. NT017]GET26124.1 hypothetical protein NT017_24530 [Prolixibacter sp. NT017]